MKWICELPYKLQLCPTEARALWTSSANFSLSLSRSSSCLSSKFPSTSARPIKNCSWKGSNYSFERNTWILPPSTNYYLSGILRWGVWPTIHRNPLHFCQTCCFFSVWLFALMRSRLHWMAVWGQLVSRETQDNECIIKGSPVERKGFLISLPLPTQPTFHLSSCIPQLFSQWWSLDATCKWNTLLWFNANQYCANIHLRRWLHGERGTSTTWNARGYIFYSGHRHGNALACLQNRQHWSLKINRKTIAEEKCKKTRILKIGVTT